MTNPHIAAHFFRSQIKPDIEEFWIAGLSPGQKILSSQCLFRGTVDSCLVHPRDVIRFVCLSNATYMIICHNHPSGDPEPSEEDIRLTNRLIKITQLIQIPLIDHIIVTQNSYTSFKENNWYKTRKK